MQSSRRFRFMTTALFLLTALGFTTLWQARTAAALFTTNYSSYAKVTADDGEADDRFGTAVTVSEDGNTIVVGAAADDLGVTQDHGSAYVYTRQAGTAVFQQQLLANGSNVKNFGASVSLSGETLAVGATGDDNNAGALYIFVKTNGSWVQTQRLTASDGAAGDFFGQSVSLNGSSLVVGASGDANNRGSAYVFVRAGSTWSQQSKLIPNDGTGGDLFGFGVTISGDTVAVGAAGASIDGNNGRGAAYIFVRNSNLWQQQQKLFAADGATGDNFGRAVTLDGNTVLIGAWLDSNLLHSSQGSAYVFARTGTVWNVQEKLVANDAASGDLFGGAVALRGDTAVIGAFGKKVGAVDLKGKIYVFTRTGMTWGAPQDFTTSNSSGSLFGHAVALANETIAVGAPRESSHKGAAYIYRPQNHAPTMTVAEPLNRQAGDGIVNNVNVATVSDQDQAVNALQMLVNGGPNATSNGVTISNLSISANGAVSATLQISCSATDTHFTLRVTDDEGDFVQALLVLNVSANTAPVLSYSSPQTVNVAGNLTVNPATSPNDNGSIMSWQALSITPSFNGGYSVNPAGVVSIGGAGPAGTYTATVRVTDNCGLIRTATFTLNVTGNCPTININPATLNNGAAGTSYNQQLMANGGGGPYSYALNAGALPNGMTLSATGLLAGTPTTFGAFNFTVRATDLNGCQGTRAFTLTISAPCPTITVNPASLPDGAVGAAYNQTVTATGGAQPYSFAISAGALPTGLSLAPNGALSGTATAAGSFNFTVRAADNNVCLGTRAYTVTINGPVVSNGLQFYPLAHPVRLLDTRPGAVGCDAPSAPISGGTARTQTAAGRSCGGVTIPANAKALTGNITTVESNGGYLTLYPSDAAQPLVANSNYSANEVLNNVFTVGLGNADGAFKLFVTSNTHVVVDVTGYYAAPGAGGLYFHPLPKPIRLLETRAGLNGCTTPGAPLPGNSDTAQLARLSCQGVTIPNEAQAIVGNATVVNNGMGYLTLYPAGVARPLVASSNYSAGQVMNAPFTVGLGANGEFMAYVTSQTDLVVDVLGYYSTEANDVNGAGLLFNPLPAPVRLLETRAGFTGCYTPGAVLAAATPYLQAATGACVNIPANARGIVGNATVVNAQAGYLTFWPSNAAQPLVAASNFTAGQVLNRHFAVGLGADGAFKLFASASTDLVIDVVGYFAP
jgi:hypothetical protein